MLARKDHTLISPTSWVTFIILLVMFRSHIFNKDPFLHLLSWSIDSDTPLVTTRSHPFSQDPFTLFWWQIVHTLLVTIRSHPFWSWPVYTFLVTTHSQPFDHNHLHPLVTTCLQFFSLATFRSRSFAPFRSKPICTLWSQSRSVPTFSVKINFTSFWSISIRTLSFMIIGIFSVTTVLYIFGQNTFTFFQSQNVHTPIKICLYLLNHNTFIPLRLWCVHIS